MLKEIIRIANDTTALDERDKKIFFSMYCGENTEHARLLMEACLEFKELAEAIDHHYSGKVEFGLYDNTSYKEGLFFENEAEARLMLDARSHVERQGAFYVIMTPTGASDKGVFVGAFKHWRDAEAAGRRLYAYHIEPYDPEEYWEVNGQAYYTQEDAVATLYEEKRPEKYRAYAKAAP